MAARRIQGATGGRPRKTAAGYLKAAGFPCHSRGGERRAGSKTGHRVITDFGAGKPASGVSSDPASPEPHLPSSSALDTAKPATEVTTHFGAKNKALGRLSISFRNYPPQGRTFEPGASKPAQGVTTDSALPPPPAEVTAPFGEPPAADEVITGPAREARAGACRASAQFLRQRREPSRWS